MQGVIRSMSREEENLFVISAFYHFVPIEDPKALQQSCLNFMHDKQLKGTLLIATEGLNGTISGRRENIDALHNWFRKDSRFLQLKYKQSLSLIHI